MGCPSLFAPDYSADAGTASRQKWLNEGCASASGLPSASEKTGLALPRHDAADLGDRDARRRCLLAQRLDLARRHACQDFVVVAAGEDGLDQRGLLGERRARRVGERHARDLDLGIDARGAAELGEIAGKPVGDVHGGRGVGAQHLGDGGARLRHEIAGREAVLLVAAQAPTAAAAAAVASQQQPERSVADGAGHHHAIARPWRRRGAPSCRAAPRRRPRSKS